MVYFTFHCVFCWLILLSVKQGLVNFISMQNSLPYINLASSPLVGNASQKSEYT